MQKLTKNNRVVRLTLVTLLAILVNACGQDESPSKKQVAWLPDTKAEQLPITNYQGIRFSGSKEQIKNQFKCTEYELTLSCKLNFGGQEDHVWVIFNETGRVVLIKKELGYFNSEHAQQIIERLTLKYGLDFEPTSGQERAFKAGLRKTKTYLFGKGQVAFQVGRSLNNRNELMLVYYFPEDVGATFAKSIQD